MTAGQPDCTENRLAPAKASGYEKPMDLRVLLVTSEFPPDVGGIASHVSELASALAAKGTAVAVVHPRSVLTAPMAECNSLPIERPGLVKGEPFYQIMLRSWLSHRLAHSPADIVHVHGVRPLGATRGLPARTVFTNHSSGFLRRLNASDARRRQTKRLLGHVEYLIGPSDELVEAARAFGYRGPAAMIPNGVDTERFTPGASLQRRRWGIGNDETVILLARRLVEKNGVADFARALQFLTPNSWRAVIAGDGPERPRMISTFGEANMLERVIFLGSVPNSQMPDIYRAADISVLPSLAEATSISGLEAMASALPLVGTRVGGIPAIIADGHTGLLVSARQPEEMAAAISRLLVEHELRRRLGDAARKRAEQEFSWSVIAARTLDAYRICVADGNARSHATASAGV